MKRVPLEVYSFAGDLRAMAHFLLKIEELSRFIDELEKNHPEIKRAIVDTGSPITLIGPLDTKRMRISKLQLNRLEGRNKPVNIGGGQILTKIINNSKLKFGDHLEIDMPVEFPIKGEENPVQPSLLGVDFLLKTKSTLVFNPNKKEAYLEIEE